MAKKGNQYKPDRRNTPSTGSGSDSALDAMVKRRGPAPKTQTQQLPTPSPPPK
jgi:hypothetical protein